MTERKFTRGLSKPGSAAQVRETVSQVVRQSTVLAKPKLEEPIDYETFVTKNKTVLNNDLQRDMLLFPPDDVSQSTLPRRFRTTTSIGQSLSNTEINNQFVKECIKTYSRDWYEVRYKYNAYAGCYSELPKVPKPDNLEDQIYEVDKIVNSGQDVVDNLRKGNEITKQGYLLKGPESGNENFISSIATKSFKRKFVILKRQLDSSYILEFHKDEKKNDAKFTICMDCCSDVIRNTRKGGKFSFELKMQDSHKSYILAVENESELEDWIDKLKQVLHFTKQEENNMRVTLDEVVGTPPVTPEHQGTLKSLEHSKNPDLMKYARETDHSIALARKECRQNLFAIYHELKSNSIELMCDAEVEPYKEKFGIKLFVRFEALKFDLQMPSELDNTNIQIEPYMTTVSLFDGKTGRKLSEEFRFDLNHQTVKGMLPVSKLRERAGSLDDGDKAGKSNQPDAKQKSKKIICEGFNEMWLAAPCQAIFDIKHPDPEIYLVIRIEKILQGSISHAVEPYLRAGKGGDGRTGCKINKAVRSSILRLGHYRMPFAWAAKPLFESSSDKFDTQSHTLPIYKQEASKSSDEDIAKYLSEWKKIDKKHRLTQIPGQARIYVERLEKKIPNCMTSSLLPVRPFPMPPTHNLTIEVQDYPSQNPADCYPYTVYNNILYVFPKCLNYETQKTFTKARNIACVVELRDRDTADSVALPCIFGRPGEPLFTTQAKCAVVHHSTSPEFYEEIKIALPVQLCEQHHLLFTFLHVSCEPSKSNKKRDLPVESVVGYSWISIYQNDRINVEEQSFPVAADLPANYLSCKPLGLGKGFSGPNIHWVEGQRCLFKCDLKLISTVYTTDKHLNNFFVNIQKLLNSNVQMNDLELSKNLKDGVRVSSGSELGREFSKYVKAMHAIDVGIMISFMPTILNQLFSLLLFNTNEDVSINVIRVLVHVIHTVTDAKKLDILISYVKYVFQVDHDSNKKSTTIHEELVKSLTITLRPVNADFLVINKFMLHSWFFFSILVKSMAQHLLKTGKIKMNRHERFSSDFMYRIQTFIQGIMPHISQKFKDLPVETKQTNRNLAYFIKKCLTLMDRGFVFKLIKLYMDMFNLGDPKSLQEYKFEFLQIVISHEHYIALNLPLMRSNLKKYTEFDSKDEIETVPVLEYEYRITPTFCRNHFLTGILLQQVRLALNEVRDVRKFAVRVLRNQLAKHAFDDRFQTKLFQAKIASLYLPFVTVIVENLNRLEQPDAYVPSQNMNDDNISTISSNSSATWYSVASSTAPVSAIATPTTSQRQLLHRNTIGPDTFSAIVRSGKHKRDSSYLSVIAGQAEMPLTQENIVSGVSSSSLNSSSSTLSAGSITDADVESNVENENKSKVDGASGHSRSQSVPLNAIRYDKFTSAEVKDLLVCFLYILKNVNEEPLIGFWEQCSGGEILEFFQVLQICLYQFKYLGKKHIASSKSSVQNGVGPKSLTLPARIVPPNFSNGNCKTISSCNGKSSPVTDMEQENIFRALLEANCATEIGLITLDVLGLYCNHFKDVLLTNDGENPMMTKISDIYLSFLKVGQSEKLLQHLFAALRSFITKFSAALYRGSATLCGKLCYEVLKCCNSCLSKTRNEACAILYLLMRSNYEFTRRKGLTRVHLQVVISVSQLLGSDTGLNCTRFQESLSIINNYATSDRAMQTTNFPSEVKDLTKRIKTVLMATMQMSEHESDPEMLVDLQHSLANSYAGTLELRKTWLESIRNNHLNHGNLSEAAMCSIHVAALVAEYLKQKGIFSNGCKAFESISSNIVQDECRIKEDAGIEDVPYIEDTLLEMLEDSVNMLMKAERFEMVSEVYKILIPIYERRRSFEDLSFVYKQLHTAFEKVVEVIKSGKRLLGKYYRVAFFGQGYFEEESEKEYVYKEPKVTSLPEISERLYRLFCEKFGKDAVKMIMDSIQINPQELDPKYAYVQITHVVPYFDSREVDQRITDYERNNKINRFVFETPFTLGGKKARGALEEQCKRKTILTTACNFPYVKKRIAVKSKQIIELKPIEVAIEEMETRIIELSEVVERQPRDLKKLQLKLQGSVSVQVNAGPLAYAVAFLDDKHISKYPKEKTLELKDVYRNFIRVCADALELNEMLITPDQEEYHSAMKDNFTELINGLSEILHEKFVVAPKQCRNSIVVFNCISGTSGSSNA